jgi:hypothetical protein
MGLYIFRCLDEQTDLDREIARGCASRLIADLSKDAVDAIDVTAIAHAAFRSDANDVFDVAFPMVVANQAADGGWATGYGDYWKALHYPPTRSCTMLCASAR